MTSFKSKPRALLSLGLGLGLELGFMNQNHVNDHAGLAGTGQCQLMEAHGLRVRMNNKVLDDVSPKGVVLEVQNEVVQDEVEVLDNNQQDVDDDDDNDSESDHNNDYDFNDRVNHVNDNNVNGDDNNGDDNNQGHDNDNAHVHLRRLGCMYLPVGLLCLLFAFCLANAALLHLFKEGGSQFWGYFAALFMCPFLAVGIFCLYKFLRFTLFAGLGPLCQCAPPVPGHFDIWLWRVNVPRNWRIAAGADQHVLEVDVRQGYVPGEDPRLRLVRYLPRGLGGFRDEQNDLFSSED